MEFASSPAPSRHRAALSHYVHPNWIWLVVFVGANLIQSAFTRGLRPPR
ncbi:MAG: hypothetical protein U1G05_05135 [Kiritimatiellia bacterium]